MAMIPININNNHWILCSIDNRLCKVSIYDSFVKEYPDLIKNLREFLSLKYIQLYGVSLTNHWSFSYIKNIPVQRNGYDCGVFICKFGEYLSKGSDNFTFLSKDMDFFRKNIILSILNNQIY
ncbi:unnamed protein product [Brachionus calyciflorus]|uniref:Ubiquitin-like protease family profile domain-containing protein n=1 Tax=Brachionus calyciflorus TaxID=104777 RepID=A0A814DZE4_9BILA|nr:unnamed protein product [Brachionus calyciflorus]